MRPLAVGTLGLAAVVILAGCGRKGPPLPPLRPVPGPVTALTVRSVDGQIELRFNVPSTNTDKSSPAAVARIEIYARSAPAGSPKPIKEQVVLKDDLVATIDVKPPVDPDAEKTPPPPGTPPPPPDPRPGDGDPVSWTEPLPTGTIAPLPVLKGRLAAAAAAAAAQQAQAAAAAAKAAAAAPAPNSTTPTGPIPPGGTPSPFGPPPSATPPAGATRPATTPPGGATPPPTAATSPVSAATPPPGTPEAAAAAARKEPAKPLPPTRYYWIQAISRHGQIGGSPDGLALPLVDPAAAPTDAQITYDEKTLTLTWKPGAEGESFRVYAIDKNGKEKDTHPLNDKPLTEAQYQLPVAFGQETCFAVRAVTVTGFAGVESGATIRCETPKDTFPPPAPTNLNGLPDNGTVQLRWDAVAASDLAGYLVLRGEGADGTLHQLTPVPIAATTYSDPTVQVGVTYVYVVVAVDQATPPNVSPHSNVYTVTIR